MPSLLDLMASPAPKTGKSHPAQPAWRKGKPIAGSDREFVPLFNGDLRWLAHDVARTWGRWYRWDATEKAWCCIDPADQTGINARPDTPPRCD